MYLVESDPGLRIELSRGLTGAGFAPRPFANVEDLAAVLPELPTGCVVLDVEALASIGAALREKGGEGAPRFPTIVLFTSLAPEDAVAAVRFGAADLLRRPFDLSELLVALRRVEPKVRAFEARLAADRAKDIVHTLTPRQQEILELVMRGLPTKKIARLLDLSPRTVEMHRARLHQRLGVTSVAELFAFAWWAGGAGTG